MGWERCAYLMLTERPDRSDVTAWGTWARICNALAHDFERSGTPVADFYRNCGLYGNLGTVEAIG